jgi:hypothetical protein
LQKINYAKKEDEPRKPLKSWYKNNSFRNQDKILKLPEDFRDEIERVDAKDITVNEFKEKYEKGDRPVIITGLSEKWPAHENWTFAVSFSFF